MANELQELYKSILDLSDERKIALGSDAAKTVIGYLSDKFEEKGAVIVYGLLVGTYVGVDSEISEEEYAFCKAVLGFHYELEAFRDFIEKTCRPENIELLDQLIDASPSEVKTAFVTLGLAICSIDDSLTANEQALLAKYID